MKYTEAIGLDCTQAVYYSNRSACFVELKLYKKASADGRKSMELDGRFSKGYYRYARAESLMGHKEEATKYARHGLSIDPACEDLRHLLVNELGVSASDLPANPNVKIQEEQTSTVPVVQGVAVSSTQMEQQQPLMMQGQQPMMMQGQQPMVSQITVLSMKILPFISSFLLSNYVDDARSTAYDGSATTDGNYFLTFDSCSIC